MEVSHNTHKSLLRDILGLNDETIKHFDLGGLVGGQTYGNILGAGGGIGNMSLTPDGNGGFNTSPVNIAPAAGNISLAPGGGGVGAAPQASSGSGTSTLGAAGALLGNAPNSAQTVAQAAPIVNPLAPGQLSGGLDTNNAVIEQNKEITNTLNGGLNQGANTQNALTRALANEASGYGPNPAQAALNQSTGANIANQAALNAGQRGAASNVGLIARENAQQGAATQQNAVGQSAALQAQQQLAAQQQLQALAAAQVGQGTGAVNNLNNASLTNQAQLLGAAQGFNNNLVGSTASQNSANASIATGNANNTADLLGTLIPAAGAAGSYLGKAFGGGGGAAVDTTAGTLGDAVDIAAAAKGGKVSEDHIGSNAKVMLAKAVAKKAFPDHLQAIAKIYHPKVLKMYCGGMADGGEIDSAENATKLSEEMQLAALQANKGAVVPGKPKVNKNSLKNDTVPALLTPKEIVLPLSVTQSDNPGEAAKAFVEKINGEKKKPLNDDFKEALRKHVANRKNKS